MTGIRCHFCVHVSFLCRAHLSEPPHAAGLQDGLAESEFGHGSRPRTAPWGYPDRCYKWSLRSGRSAARRGGQPMNRWVTILVSIPCLVAILGVAPTGASTNPRTVPETSPGYWLMTGSGATYAYNVPYLADVATNSAGNPLDHIERSDCGNGPGTPIPEVTQCVAIS